MVFVTAGLWRKIVTTKPCVSPDRYWKRRRILRMSAHFYGRRRNCYTVALNGVRRALKYLTLGRAQVKKEKQELCTIRLQAACEEQGFRYSLFKKSLLESNILLEKHILSDLACFEPRSFKCLTDFAWAKAKSEGFRGINELGDAPDGVILKPMINK